MSSFATYFSYEEFFRGGSEEQDLINCLSRYDGLSVLHFVLRLNTELLIWNNGLSTSSPKYLSTVYKLLPNILGDQMVFELKRKLPSPLPQRAFFHIRQLIYLAKMALRYCPFGTGLMFGTHGIEAGLILLKANDQLHIRNRSGLESADEETRDYALLSEFIAVNEFSGSDPGDVALRAYQMLFELAPAAHDQPFYLDLQALFLGATGISLEQYFAMCFSLFVGTIQKFYAKSALALTFGPQTWDKSTLPKSTIESFWDQVSLPLAAARSAVHTDYGNSDVTVFRKWPLIEQNGFRFGFDSTFFMEKLWAGPFWTIFNTSDATKNKLPQLTGWLFERYLNKLLTDTCSGPNVFVPEPKKCLGNEEELTDGLIICGESLILIEYKSVMFTAESKYAGDRSLLKAEINKKLVLNERGKAKGVGQLKKVIDYLNNTDLKVAVQGHDLSQIRFIYPVIVTLEPLGDGLVISRILNREFDRLQSQMGGEKFVVRRLHCTGVSTIQRLSGVFAESAFTQVLDEWDQADPPLRGSLKMYFDPAKHKTGKPFNHQHFEKLEAHMLPLLKLQD